MRRFTIRKTALLFALFGVLLLFLGTVKAEAAYDPNAPLGSVMLTKRTNTKSASIYIGRTYELEVKMASAQVKWKSSDDSVASVEVTGKKTALVTAVSEGAVTITATTKNGRVYTYGIEVHKFNTELTEPGENEWGMLYKNKKTVKWIPEMTFDLKELDITEPDELNPLLLKAAQHGTCKITFKNWCFDIYSMEWENYWDCYGAEDPYGDSCNGCTLGYAMTYKDRSDPNNMIVFLLPTMGSTFLYSNVLIGYDIDRVAEVTKNRYESTHFYNALATSDNVALCEQKAREIINEVLQDPDISSDEDVIRVLHDYFCDNATFDSDNNKGYVNDARGVLFYGEGCCASYTDAMMMCLTLLGYRNVSQTIHGHIFNKVQLDGKWYNVDVMIDDRRMESYIVEKHDYTCFLLNNWEYCAVNDIILNDASKICIW